MTYWTLMVITILSGQLDGTEIDIPFPSKALCREAVPSVTAKLPYDFSVDCEQSSFASASITPRKRP